MAIIGTLTSIGLWLVGADYWLLFGTVSGLLGIIPYVGIAIVVLFSVPVISASAIGRLPWVLGVLLVSLQFGSASCRYSVCPFGEFSVVVVSFNRKCL